MSFGPFLGGKRVCLGKTFAESFAKIVVAIITYNVEFKYVNEEYMTKRPTINFTLPDPGIMVMVSVKNMDN